MNSEYGQSSSRENSVEQRKPMEELKRICLLYTSQTRLIVIDTLQRIRAAGNDANPYASDYRDIGVLKALADKHRIAILLIHHLRKMNDDDPMDMISGTTGLSGATDSNFCLLYTSRCV